MPTMKRFPWAKPRKQLEKESKGSLQLGSIHKGMKRRWCSQNSFGVGEIHAGEITWRTSWKWISAMACQKCYKWAEWTIYKAATVYGNHPLVFSMTESKAEKEMSPHGGTVIVNVFEENLQGRPVWGRLCLIALPIDEACKGYKIKPGRTQDPNCKRVFVLSTAEENDLVHYVCPRMGWSLGTRCVYQKAQCFAKVKALLDERRKTRGIKRLHPFPRKHPQMMSWVGCLLWPPSRVQCNIV